MTASPNTTKHASAPPTPARSAFPRTSNRIGTPARASADEPTIPDQHQPTLQDHKSITVTEDMASMTQQIHLSQVKATGTPTSHAAIMNNQDQHARTHDDDL